MEVPARPPCGRLAVDLVDEVIGQHVVVAIIRGRGVGRHRQEQNCFQHPPFVRSLDRRRRENDSIE